MTKNERVQVTEFININEIKVNPRNARKHSRKQISQLRQSIQKFGFLAPVIIANDCTLLAGHARVQAARSAGLKSIPAVRISHLSESEQRAYLLADNRLAELSVWDQNALEQELQLLSTTEIAFDFSAIGFDTLVPKQSPLREDLNGSQHKNGSATPAQTTSADLWILGDHRIYCGDALDSKSYEAALRGEPADAALGVIAPLGSKTRNDKQPDASQLISHLTNHVVDGGLLYLCVDWSQLYNAINVALPRGKFRQLCIWIKQQYAIGSYYKNSHELIALFEIGKSKQRRSIKRSDVWHYSIDYQNADRAVQQLPVTLVEALIADSTEREDSFLTVGSSLETLIAATSTGRRARIIESDTEKTKAAIEWWQQTNNKVAKLIRPHHDDLTSSGQRYEI